MIQWMRPHLPVCVGRGWEERGGGGDGAGGAGGGEGDAGSIPGWEMGSYMPCGQKKQNINNRSQCCRKLMKT